MPASACHFANDCPHSCHDVTRLLRVTMELSERHPSDWSACGFSLIMMAACHSSTCRPGSAKAAALRSPGSRLLDHAGPAGSMARTHPTPWPQKTDVEMTIPIALVAVCQESVVLSQC